MPPSTRPKIAISSTASWNAWAILRPPGAAVTRIRDALDVADGLGYPVVARPSYVLGGRAMQVVDDRAELESYIEKVTQPSPEHPVLIDKYLQGREVEVDAICDGRDSLIPGNHGTH